MKIMKTTSKVFLLFLMVLVAGCATGIKGTPNEVTAQTISPRSGYGVVFGRICEGNGLRFRSKSHRENEYLHIGGKTAFALQLPQGDYQLVDIGSPVGVMVTDKPLEFTVTAGAVDYVGSLLPLWNGGGARFPGACASEEGKLVRSFFWSNKGTFRTSNPVWEMTLANDLPSALRDIKQAFPLLDTTSSKVNLMH